jgi:hypothetical protein
MAQGAANVVDNASALRFYERILDNLDFVGYKRRCVALLLGLVAGTRSSYAAAAAGAGAPARAAELSPAPTAAQPVCSMFWRGQQQQAGTDGLNTAHPVPVYASRRLCALLPSVCRHHPSVLSCAAAAP